MASAAAQEHQPLDSEPKVRSRALRYIAEHENLCRKAFRANEPAITQLDTRAILDWARTTRMGSEAYMAS
jgi:hypothetical protein